MIGGTLIHAGVRTGPGPEESSQANLFPLSFGCGVQIERMQEQIRAPPSLLVPGRLI
jgi:hypothetical protein